MTKTTDAFLLTIKDNLSGTFVEFGENIIDNLDLIDSKLIQSIPILSTMFGAYKSYTSISDKLFIKKIIKFFQGIDCTRQERRKFFEDCQRNNSLEEIVEIIITDIQKCESSKKIEIISIIFGDYIKMKLSRDEFDGLVHIITNCRLSLLENMPWPETNEVIREETLPEGQIDLVFLGLLCEATYLEVREDEEDFQSLKDSKKYIEENTKREYCLTLLGKLLLRYI